MEALFILIVFGGALVPCGMVVAETGRYMRDMEALERGQPLPGGYEIRLAELLDRERRGGDVRLELDALRHELELTLRLYEEA